MRLLIPILVLALGLLRLEAAVRKAGGVDTNSVQVEINKASDGDIVFLPPGEATWDNYEALTSKRIRIHGSDSGPTSNRTSRTIIHVGPHVNKKIVFFQNSAPNSSLPYGVADLTIDGAHISRVLINIGSSTTSTNRYFRVTGVSVTNLVGRAIQSLGQTEGLFDRNRVNWNTDQGQQAFTLDGYNRAGQLTSPPKNGNPQWGVTNNYLVVENNIVDATQPGDSGCEFYKDRWGLVRYNKFYNVALGVHEHGENRSAPVWDFCHNEWFMSNSQSGRWLVLRSGVGVVHDNTITVTPPAVTRPDIVVQVYRTSGTNSPTLYYYPYGTVTVAPSPPDTGTILSVASGSRFPSVTTVPRTMLIWPAGEAHEGNTNVERVSVTAHALYNNPQTTNFTIVRGTPARSIQVGDQIMDAIGIGSITGTNRIDCNCNNATTLGYPWVDQVGWGDPVTWTATNGTPTLWGAWSWNNSVNGNTNTAVFGINLECTPAQNPFYPNCNYNVFGYDGVTTVPNGPDMVVDGRDVFTNQVMVGYAELPYPFQTVKTLSITPSSSNIGTNEPVTFSTSGGFVPYNYVILDNQSGGAISDDGHYTSGLVQGVTDTIRVMDLWLNVADATVTTSPPVDPPSATFSADPTTITSGQSSLLTWTTTGATSVTLDGGAVAANGSTNVSPVVTTTYTLFATNSVGSTTKNATVTVISPTPPGTNQGRTRRLP
jgi:hypothetical protein